MTRVQPWLPPTALFDGALRAAVAADVETWRSRWIASSTQLSVRLDACNASDVLPEQGWRTACGALRLHADAKMKTRLIAAVLQSRRAAQASTAPDRALLDGLSEMIYCDLLDQNQKLFDATTGCQSLASGAPADAQPALMRFCISGSGGAFGFLTVTAGAAARARKSLAKPAAQKPPLEARQRAVAAHHVRIGARVGAGPVSLSDLASLAIGDVLVLDKRMTDPFDVTLNGQPSAGRTIEIRRNGAALFIRSTGKQAYGNA